MSERDTSVFYSSITISAMIVDNSKAEKLMTTKRNLE